MRQFTIILLLAASAFAFQGDKRQRVYLDKFMEPCGKGKAEYVKEAAGQEGELYKVVIRTMDGALKAEGTCADPALEVKHGHWRFYHLNGKLESEGEYAMGNKSGIWQRFDTWGQTLAEKVYDPEPLENILYTMAPTMPSYPGGEQAMVTYLRSSAPTSVGATAVFVVEKDGDLSGIKVLNADSIAADQLVDALDRAPRFGSGMKDGLPVRVLMRVPIK